MRTLRLRTSEGPGRARSGTEESGSLILRMGLIVLADDRNKPDRPAPLRPRSLLGVGPSAGRRAVRVVAILVLLAAIVAVVRHWLIAQNEARLPHVTGQGNVPDDGSLPAGAGAARRSDGESESLRT